jgi:hypothetical protein
MGYSAAVTISALSLVLAGCGGEPSNANASDAPAPSQTKHAVARYVPASFQIVDGRIVVDDARQGSSLDQFQYVGRWEHVRDRYDGRSSGTSSRSRWESAAAILPFTGRRIYIYGVSGPNGGTALVSIDRGDRSERIDFASPAKVSHALVYASPPLSPGLHTLIVDVWGSKYVNIDGVEIER